MAYDCLGRRPTLVTCFALQALLIVLLSATDADSLLANPIALALVSGLIGACYRRPPLSTQVSPTAQPRLGQKLTPVGR